MRASSFNGTETDTTLHKSLPGSAASGKMGSKRKKKVFLLSADDDATDVVVHFCLSADVVGPSLVKKGMKFKILHKSTWDNGGKDERYFFLSEAKHSKIKLFFNGLCQF